MASVDYTTILCSICLTCSLFSCATCHGLIGRTISCSYRQDLNNISMEIACPNAHVLVDVDVVGATFAASVGQTGDVCMGRTIHMKIDVADCHWKQACVVRFPTQKMLSCLAVNETSYVPCPCFLETPDSVVVRRAKCALKKLVNDISAPRKPKNKDKQKGGKKRKNKKRGVTPGSVRVKRRAERSKNKKRSGKTIDKGIIKSHVNFPWFYKKDLTRKKTFKLKYRSADRSGMDLAIDVKMRHICGDDVLTVKRNSKSYNKFAEALPRDTYGDVIYKFRDVDVRTMSVSFRKNTIEENGCEGFVLCYKAVTRREIHNNSSICDDPELVTDADVTLHVHSERFHEDCCSNNGNEHVTKGDTCYIGQDNECSFTCP